MQLPDYQEKIENYHAKFLNLFAPYTRAEDKEKYYSDLAGVLSKHAGKVRELANAQPRIMLYGVYNAGKSTLLNAIIGEPKAKVGDIPTTYETTSFHWRGYELIDTPGIGAPIEH